MDQRMYDFLRRALQGNKTGRLVIVAADARDRNAVREYLRELFHADRLTNVMIVSPPRADAFIAGVQEVVMTPKAHDVSDFWAVVKAREAAYIRERSA